MHYGKGSCLLRMRKPEESLKEFDQILVMDTRYAPAYYGRAKALHMLGESTKEDAFFFSSAFLTSCRGLYRSHQSIPRILHSISRVLPKCLRPLCSIKLEYFFVAPILLFLTLFCCFFCRSGTGSFVGRCVVQPSSLLHENYGLRYGD